MEADNTQTGRRTARATCRRKPGSQARSNSMEANNTQTGRRTAKATHRRKPGSRARNDSMEANNTQTGRRTAKATRRPKPGSQARSEASTRSEAHRFVRQPPTQTPAGPPPAPVIARSQTPSAGRKPRNVSRHSVAEIAVTEPFDHLQRTVAATDGNRRVRHPVEHGGLHHRIVDHILEHHPVAHRGFPDESPVALVIARKLQIRNKTLNK